MSNFNEAMKLLKDCREILDDFVDGRKQYSPFEWGNSLGLQECRKTLITLSEVLRVIADNM